MKITYKDIEAIVGYPISEHVKNTLNDFNPEFEFLSQETRDKLILQIINHINLPLETVGQHRLEKWEKGWYENFELLKTGKNVKHLIPKYHGKYDYTRWKGELIKGNTNYFDYHLLIVMIDSILHEYVGTKYNNLFEFGCGPSYHLLRFGEFNPDINLIGLDWTVASQNIIKEINQLGINDKIKGHNFNFFEPNYQIDIPENSAIFTVNALEQVGENYKDFVNFLLYKKPDLCLNFEPMPEILDQNNLIDQLCVMYSEKRNYLQGYLPYLQQLESEGKIEIIDIKRLYGGSLYIEGSNVVIWKPKK